MSILNNLYHYIEKNNFKNKEKLLSDIEKSLNNEEIDESLLKKIQKIIPENSIENKQIENYFNNKLKGISLFANVGIAETYIDKYVDVFVANELLKNRAEFYSEMHPYTDMIQGSILEKENLEKIINKGKSYGCDFILGTPPCFRGDTKVLTKKGYTKISEIDSNDYVLTHKGRFRKVLHIGSKDNTEIYSLKAQGIKETFTTSNHPYYVREMNYVFNNVSRKYERVFSEPIYKEVKDIVEKKDFIAIPKIIAEKIKINKINAFIDEDYIWLPVKEIKNTKIKETVYNIEVKEDNTYTANNAVVHNCQGMSMAGKMEEDDPRNSLIIKIYEVIKEIKPKYFLIENVSKMPETYIIFKGNKIKIKDFLNDFLGDEYHINIDILNAKDFGTPQSRKRSFVIGSLKSEKEWKFPTKKQKEITVRDAISYLPSLEAGEKSDIPYHYAKKHNGRHILWMKNTPSGKTSFLNPVHYPKKEDGTKIKGFATTYKRIDWDKPAPTITMANGSISSQNNVHPGRKLKNGEYSDARVLTLKEIFILTGLPDNWTPPKWASENLIRQVIGEGVPPRLIEAILEELPNDK